MQEIPTPKHFCMIEATMEQITENSSKMSVSELREHPEILANLIIQDDQDISLSVSKHGNEIIVNRKTYTPEFISTLQRAKQMVKKKMDSGYTRQQAGKDFVKLQEEISDQFDG